VSDGLLLTRRERVGGFLERSAIATAPSLVVALLPVASGQWVTAAAVVLFGVLCGLGIGSSVRSVRGAVGAGVFVAALQLGFDLWLAYAASHPVLPGDP
jgi:hypothetical protein